MSKHWLGTMGALSLRAHSFNAGWWQSGAVLDLDFAAGRGYNLQDTTKTTPDSILTYTAPSPKMVYGDDGVLRYAPHNLLTCSQTFDNASWSKPQATVTADAAVAPDGTTTADALLDTAVSNIHYTGQSIASFSPANRTFTVSVYLKASTLGYATVGLSDVSSGTLFAVAVFNLSNGTVATSGASGTGYAVVSSSITNEGNGWYRCVVTATAGTSASFLTAVIGLNNTGVISGAAGGFESYLGNGSGIFSWGAQVSRGYTAFAYIPTTAAAVYSLPIDHDPITFDPLGVLIEEQRTNLLLQSANFTATWSIGGNSVTADQIVAPDGTMTADMLTMVASSSVYQNVTVAASTAYVFTFWAKRGTRTQLNYRIYDNSNAANIIAATSYYSQTSSSVWTRITVAFTTPIGCTSVRCYVDDSADGATGTLYPWGAQLEAGAFPTSYIPTVASQVTRAADQVSILTSAFAYNSAEGTCVSEQDANFDVAAFVRVPAILTDGGSNYIRPYLYPNRGGLSIITGGVSQCDVGGGGEALTTGVAFKLATAWATNDVAKVVNGLTVGTDTSVSIPTGITSLRIGSSGNNVNVVSGHIKRLTYFPTRKSNAELQALSA